MINGPQLIMQCRNCGANVGIVVQRGICNEIIKLSSHRCIKPCFFVLGLDFFHFNSCGALFSPRSIKYIYFDFKPFSTKIFGKVWSQIGFFHFLLILMVGNPSSE